MHFFSLFRFPCLLLLLVSLSLTACGGKGASGPGIGPYTGPPCMDVLAYPQDLTVYANAAAGKGSLSTTALADAAARQKEAFYKPWRQTKPGRWVQQSLDRNFNMKPDRAYTDNKKPFPAGAWSEIEANSNKKAFGRDAGPAIVLRHTNLRAMPTGMHYYLRPDLPGEGYPFDYFQHTSLPVGTPLYISNTSRDGLWKLVESALTAGWVPASDIARVDEAFMERWQQPPLAALVREPVSLGETQGIIGALLPLAGPAPHGFGHALQVYVPQRAPSGRAGIAVQVLPPDAAVAVPLDLTPANVARIGNNMIGQAYGWGGLDRKRDCSALTRDLLAPFGLFLPRNSSNQAKLGSPLSLAGMDVREKEAAIIRYAEPFRSLVWLRGHIGVYVGTHQGKAMIFHNMWGLRTKDASGSCDNRAVVGKAVVTTLRPGVERPDLCTPNSFLDRIETVTNLPQ